MMTDLRPFLALLRSEILLAAVDEADGRALHVVGGALRDAILGFQSPDLDLVIAGEGDLFAAKLGDTLGARLVRLGGNRFSAYRLVAENSIIDIWDRGEKPLLADLERRDLTVNAMALDPAESTLIDPFGGHGDLANRCLKAVTESSFRNDPLRVIRLIRFAQLLDSFSIDGATLGLARAAAPALAGVASERVREEVNRLLVLPPAVRAFQLLTELGVFSQIWRQPDGVTNPPMSLEPLLERFEDTTSRLAALSDRGPNRQLALFALVEICLGAESLTDDDSGPRRVAPSCRCLTRSQIPTVTRLAMIGPEQTKLSPRRFLRRWGILWPEAAAVAWSLRKEDRPRLLEWTRSVSTLIEAEGEAVLAPKPLVDGTEICEALGIDPGPEVGRILERLLDAEMDGLIESRDEALALLPELIREA